MGQLIEWEVVDDDQMPLHGPPCGVTPNGHVWHLTIEEGQMSLTSGCAECDDAILGPCGGDDVYMGALLRGRMVFEPDHPNIGGWHGMDRCDCGWQWRFDPRYLLPLPSEEPMPLDGPS